MELSFAIRRWDAWLPGIRGQSPWQEFLCSRGRPSADAPFAGLELVSLPPAQRRRLSDISKITLDVALTVTDKTGPVCSVFASRRGEVGRMADLLHCVCTGEDLSPTAFSMSVHNTTSGLYSIQAANQASSTAIAAGHDTVIAGLIEACTSLASGQQQVLLVITEDLMPEVYQSFATTDEQPVAAAFLLVPGDDFIVTLSNSKEPKNLSGTSTQVIRLINTIINGEPALVAGERMQCQIHRAR